MTRGKQPGRMSGHAYRRRYPQAAVRADCRASQGRQSSRHHLRSLGDSARRRGHEGALGCSLNGPASRRDAQSTAIGDRWQCSQSCRRRTRPSSSLRQPGRPFSKERPWPAVHRRPETSLHRRSSWGLTPSRPPCASRGRRRPLIMLFGGGYVGTGTHIEFRRRARH